MSAVELQEGTNKAADVLSSIRYFRETSKKQNAALAQVVECLCESLLATVQGREQLVGNVLRSKQALKSEVMSVKQHLQGANNAAQQ